MLSPERRKAALYSPHNRKAAPVSGPGPTNPKGGIDLTSPTSGMTTGTSGIDRLRTRPSQKVPWGTGSKSSQRFGPRPITGKHAAEHGEPVAYAPEWDLAEARTLAKTDDEMAMIGFAEAACDPDKREDRPANLKMARILIGHCEPYPDSRSGRISALLSKALGA